VERLCQGLAAGLQRFVDQLELSSAHVLFPQQSQAALLEASGMVGRVGIQYHWQNAGYRSFDDFLARYSSKRRNQIKRERRALVEQGVQLEVLTGSDLRPDHMDHAYRFYCATVDKYHWGRRYLNREFFQELCSRMPEQVLLVLAKEQSSGDYIAGALNLLGTQRLFGRYWGATRELRHLHFNVCYYQGIEEAIRRGLSVFEPGAGGEHKVARGFEPTLTYSAHYLRHPQLNSAVRRHLISERQLIEQQLRDEPPLLKPG
jgi:predicted N-acyltransferase